MNRIEAIISGERLLLLKEKAVFWAARRWLIVGDLHVGKGAHFRQQGIPVHNHTHVSNQFLLAELIQATDPVCVVFLGDLGHSGMTREWDSFVDMLDNFPGVKRVLVRGNHDILDPSVYQQAGFELCEIIREGPFLFTHEFVHAEDHYTISAHIHPAVRLVGPAGQSLRLPCFWFAQQAGVLPAFGQFTGMHVVHPSPHDQVFVVAEHEVLQIGPVAP